MKEFKLFLDDNGSYGLMKPINLQAILSDQRKQIIKEIFNEVENYILCDLVGEYGDNANVEEFSDKVLKLKEKLNKEE